MRCRISIKILQRLTTNVKMKRITKEVFLLIIFTGSLFCFVVLDYEGRFYGIQSLIFNNNFLPNNDSFEMDDYETFRILDMDGFRIAGPGFRMNGTNNKISSIEKYAIYKSNIYIQCQTENGLIEDYCLNTSSSDILARNNVFQLISHREELPWKTKLILKFKRFKISKLLSLSIMAISILLYSVTKLKKCHYKSM